MAERNWTPAQQRAIDFDGKNLLLSAAAGSGKTATLTQRIIRLLKDPACNAEISRMLVVTFTNAAAGELKQRIGDALSSAIAEDPGNKHIIKQLAALENAHISTIHSFFKSELTPYAVSLGLPPAFDIIDEAESTALQAEAMRETCDSFFESDDETVRQRFESLVDCISKARSESNVDEFLLKVRNALASVGIDEKKIYANAEILRENAHNICATTYYDAIKKKTADCAEYYKELFLNIADELASSEITADCVDEVLRCADVADGICKIVNESYLSIRSFFNGIIKFPNLKGKRGEDRTEEYVNFTKIRDKFKEFTRKTVSSYFELDDEEMSRICYATAEKIEMLSDVISKFNSIFTEKKCYFGSVDYNDLEKYALQVFCTDNGEPTPAAKAVGEKFDYIFIDEYQDTNAVQDMVFSAVSCGCGRFMVGDVKQSIYTFRGAKPEIFTEYRKKYERGEDGEAVFMSENFRSDSGVINFSNLVSEYVFATKATPFEESDRLIFAKKEDNGAPAEICIVEKTAGEEEDAANPEAEYVAERIKCMLDGSDGSQNLQPRDIAILLRGKAAAEDYVRALAKRGVAATSGSPENFFGLGEVLLVMCLLNAVDNPLRDVYLAGAMKSPLCGFELSELVRIRRRDKDPLWYSVRRYADDGSDSELKGKCSAFVEKLNKWRNAAKELPADEMLRLIISETGLLRYEGDGVRTQSDIARSVKTLISHSCTVSRKGGGLHELVVYLNSLAECRGKEEFLGDENKVTIMTVHSSKGLEFPVCFICECMKGFNTTDKKDLLIIGANGEIALSLYDSEGIVRCDTALRRALGEGLARQCIEEEARVLYVAMTRARERLIITFKSKDIDKTLTTAAENARRSISAHVINSASDWATWILDAAMRNIGNDCFVINKVRDIKSDTGTVELAIENTDGCAAGLKEFLGDTSGCINGREYLHTVPAKLTVSKLRPDILNLGEEAVSLDCGGVTRMPKKMPMPRFMSGEAHSAADAGVATHIFMQFCDWKRLYDEGAETELKRLLSHGFISEENAALVRLDEIELFRRSDIIARLISAKEVFREKRFNASLPADNFTTDKALAENLCRDGINITVQGVVDCIFTDSDGKTVLLDYKTDRLTPEELEDRSLAEKKLVARHRRQLSVYRDICEDILGKKFDGVYIYSLPLGDIIEIKKDKD